jgi:hypothetical protein
MQLNHEAGFGVKIPVGEKSGEIVPEQKRHEDGQS